VKIKLNQVIKVDFKSLPNLHMSRNQRLTFASNELSANFWSTGISSATTRRNGDFVPWVRGFFHNNIIHNLKQVSIWNSDECSIPNTKDNRFLEKVQVKKLLTLFCHLGAQNPFSPTSPLASPF
jgi:hypothetical protein